MKKTSNAIAAFCLLNSVSVFALGLGEIQTSSALNQILNAKIPLLSSKNEDPSNIRVHIASKEVFDKAGIDRPINLSKLNFTPVLSKTGDIFVEVKSTSTIKEPFVNFILEVEWPQGRTLKEFTILLDPPVTMSDVKTIPVKLAKAPTLTKIVTSQPTTPRPTNTTPQSTEYGPVGRLDTLWSITKRVNVFNGSAVSHNQMMLALFENNPEAFYMNNINALKKGAILKIPSTDEIIRRSASQANNEYRKQNTLWSTSTKASTSPTKKKSQETTGKSNETLKPVTKSKLSLLTPKQEELGSFTAEKNSSGFISNASSASANANIAIEMATTLEEENKEVKSRLSDVEAQVANLQRLLVLKDKQLKRLQSNTADQESKKIAAPKEAATTTKEKNNAPEGDDNLALYGGGLVIALLGLLLIRRRKEKTSTFDDLPIIDNTKITPEVIDEVADEDISSDATELAEPEALAEVDNTSQTTDVADPVDECDVYIAYGRYQQAEDVISKALTSNPENLKYKLKLLDIHFASGNAKEFEELANSLTELQESDIEAWNNIADMGEELCPGSSLFLVPLHEEASNEEVTPDIENTINFEIPETDTPQIEDVTEAKSDDDFEFDFDLINNEAPTEIAEEDNEDSPEDQLTPTGKPFNEDCSKGHIETKISLAEAYIEMDDLESARDALNEVIESGSETEKEQAQEMLNKL